ncbi:hypothetical protein L917_20343, partial [Phytophthora nicotianae]
REQVQRESDPSTKSSESKSSCEGDASTAGDSTTEGESGSESKYSVRAKEVVSTVYLLYPVCFETESLTCCPSSSWSVCFLVMKKAVGSAEKTFQVGWNPAARE